MITYSFKTLSVILSVNKNYSVNAKKDKKTK